MRENVCRFLGGGILELWCVAFVLQHAVFRVREFV